MDWTLVKQLHVALALLTATSFSLRGYWMLARSPLLEAPATRWLPHVVDSLLFLTGLAMAVALSISPGTQPWFAAKLVAIVIYVFTGLVALKRGRTYRHRAIAFALSLAVLAYVFAVASSHDPLLGVGR